MSEYQNPESPQDQSLLAYVKRCEGNNEIYVYGYFFCLNDHKELHFFYTPHLYWESILIDELEPWVIDNLKRYGAVIENYEYKGWNGRDLDECEYEYESISFEQVDRQSDLGNHYCTMGNHVYTTPTHIYVSGDHAHVFGAERKPIQQFDAADLDLALSLSCMTSTPKYIQSIYELDCFTQVQEE